MIFLGIVLRVTSLTSRLDARPRAQTTAMLLSLVVPHAYLEAASCFSISVPDIFHSNSVISVFISAKWLKYSLEFNYKFENFENYFEKYLNSCVVLKLLKYFGWNVIFQCLLKFSEFHRNLTESENHDPVSWYYEGQKSWSGQAGITVSSSHYFLFRSTNIRVQYGTLIA